MATKLSFSLGKPKKDAQPVGTAPPLTRIALDDGEQKEQGSSSGKTARKKNDMTNMAAQAVSRKAQRRMDAELKVDNTVFQYDEIWDGMKLAEAKAKAIKEDNPDAKKPKYMENLIRSAETRRLDHLRAEEKMMQREREAEGDEFADKEKFVTQAYKDQMAEVRRAEAEEKAREEAERKKNKGLGGGMTHFYKRLLDDASKSHDAAVAASATPSSDPPLESVTAPGRIGPAPEHNLTVTRPRVSAPRPLEVAPNPDAVLSKPQVSKDGETRTVITEGGTQVEINDNNEVVDKRELLSAGLNLALPNTRNLSLLRAIHGSSKQGSDEPVAVHRAAGVAASKSEIRQRQRVQLEQQLEEERKRLVDEKEREEREERERIVRRRNDDSAVQDAKERYLARKRRKLEEEKGVQEQGGET
ncbi:Nuclear speckle splicing regulatory protein [Ceratobasidium theobromae]|uniref:Nuclear speckle splicing regulatory protein n=1 Tax=Ceratobasidium theobromae TaxID=1582974 RepID=A0A5N5QV48_9AGAM|nr:Nuclear speckle splicing regulatory protein [Ceratobasidium theobromae]